MAPGDLAARGSQYLGDKWDLRPAQARDAGVFGGTCQRQRHLQRGA